jgi:hypothetical protein
MGAGLTASVSTRTASPTVAFMSVTAPLAPALGLLPGGNALHYCWGRLPALQMSWLM